MGQLGGPRQERFCIFYVASGDAAAAAYKAGYSRNTSKTASEMLRRPQIAARVAELQAEVSRRLMDIAMDEILSEIERKQVLTVIARHPIEKPVSAGHKIAAIETLNKMDGLYKEADRGYVDNRQIIFVVSNKDAIITEEAIRKRLGDL